MKRLSIIIPMYNVATYVERCIRSLEDQDIPKEEYELICVNDGSPDNCREIVEQLQQEFSNIVLINQENQGVSIARNNAMDRASGKYLLMIDPDDYVDNNSLSRVLKTPDEYQAQVSFLGFSFLNEDSSLGKAVLNEVQMGKVFPGTEAYYIARGDGRTDPDRTWAILYEREFINKYNLRYLPNVPYLEDGELIARIMCLAERCIFDGHSFYQRTTRPGSATNSNLFYSAKSINGFILAAINLKNFQQDHKLNEKQIAFLYKPIAKFVILALTPYVGKYDIIGFIRMRNKLKKLGLIKLNPNNMSIGYKKRARALNFSSLAFFFFILFRIDDKITIQKLKN